MTQDTIRLGNLETIRDFTFVKDTVDGMVKAAQVPGIEGQVLNLGTGQEIKIGELARKIIARSGRRVEIVTDIQRLRPHASEVLRLLSDNSLAVKSLGWQPSVSLDDGLAQTMDWIKVHLDHYRIGTYEF